MFFAAGLSLVILQMAAHERAHLTRLTADGIEGHPVAHARLASVLQKTVRWYKKVSLIMGPFLLCFGFYFFSVHRETGSPVRWIAPWCIEVLAVVATFLLDPIISFLEGCGWVPQVAKMRMVQAVTGSLMGWLALFLRYGLFAPAAIVACQAAISLAFIVKKHGRLLRQLLQYSAGTNAVNWRDEIWPFQWGLAISVGSSYFIFGFLNPVLFAFRGAREAGRMGMSLNVASAIGAVAISWISTHSAPHREDSTPSSG
jgi:hypothetical protein